MINWPAAQTRRWRCPGLALPPLHILPDGGRRQLICKQPISAPPFRPAMCTFSSQAPPHLTAPNTHIPPHIGSPPDQDVMLHDIISSGAANLPAPLFFLSLPHTGHLSSQTGLPLGPGAQGQDWVTHSGWVKQARGEARDGEGKKKVLLFQSRLNITIIKLQG